MGKKTLIRRWRIRKGLKTQRLKKQQGESRNMVVSFGEERKHESIMMKFYETHTGECIAKSCRVREG